MYIFAISDMDKSLQTDELKTDILDMVRNFVLKDWRHYNPHCAGGNPSEDDLDDLVYSIYCDLMTPKGRDKSNPQSFLDRYDPGKNATGAPMKNHLASVIRSSVDRKLIDKERHDSRFSEKNYSTNSDRDDDNSGVDMDFLAMNSQEAQDQDLNSVAEDNGVDYDNFTFDADMIGTMRDNWDEFSDEKKQEIKDIFNKNKKNLPQSFIDAFTDLFNDGSDAPASKPSDAGSDAEFENAPAPVEHIKVGGKPAIRLKFDSKDARSSADLAEFTKEVQAQGYQFYVNRGQYAYFVKQ